MSAPLANIAWRVAELLRTHGLVLDETFRGPVPLGQLFDECMLRHTALPQLTRRAIKSYLLEQGIETGDLGPDDEPILGFLLTQNHRGWAFVNATDILPRRRFTAAHELGHFILHRDLMPTGHISDTQDSILETMEPDALQDMEREANQFAVELLMPAAMCRQRAEELQKAHGCCPRTVLAYRLSAELLVSRESLRYRLQALELGHE